MARGKDTRNHPNRSGLKPPPPPPAFTKRTPPPVPPSHHEIQSQSASNKVRDEKLKAGDRQNLQEQSQRDASNMRRREETDAQKNLRTLREGRATDTYYGGRTKRDI